MAYVVALCVYQIGMLLTGGGFGVFTIVAFVLVIGFIYLLARPYKESTSMNVDMKRLVNVK